MRFTCDRDMLAEAVTAVAQGLPARASDPVYLGLLVHASHDLAQLTASDGDTTFNKAIDAEIAEPGEVIVPRIFPEMIRSLAGQAVTVTADRKLGTVSCGRSMFTFSVEPGEKYPFPLLDVPVLGEVDGEQFRQALKKVLPAADPDNPVAALTTVMLQAGTGLSLVATDKYAMAYSRCDMGQPDHAGRIALLPGRLAQRIAKMDGEQLYIGWDEGRIGVRSGRFTITCKQMEGQFPKQWTMILKEKENWTDLPQGLAAAVKRAALTLGEKEPVHLQFGNELTVSTQGSKAGFAESFPLEFAGETVYARTGAGMLLDALACCDQVCAEQDKPLLFRGENARYLIQIRRGDVLA